MSEDTWGNITILLVDKDRAEAIGDLDCEHEEDGGTVTYSADELRGGEFGCENLLSLHKIPFYRSWGATYDGAAGDEKNYLTDSGRLVSVVVYDANRGKLSARDIEDAYKKGSLEDIKKLIDDRNEKDKRINWSEQIELREKLIVNPSYAIFFDPSFKDNIESFSNVNEHDAYGNTALMHSILTDNYDLFEALVTISDVNSCNKNGDSPLITAATRDTAYVSELIKNGADINAQNDIGLTALMMAANNKESLKILLEAGADTWIQDNQENTVAHYAKYKELQAMIEKHRLAEDADQEEINSLSL